MEFATIGVEQVHLPLDYVMLVPTLGAGVQERGHPVLHEPCPEVAEGPTLTCEPFLLDDTNALHFVIAGSDRASQPSLVSPSRLLSWSAVSG